jgi:hypothetical protein
MIKMRIIIERVYMLLSLGVLTCLCAQAQYFPVTPSSKIFYAYLMHGNDNSLFWQDNQENIVTFNDDGSIYFRDKVYRYLGIDDTNERSWTDGENICKISSDGSTFVETSYITIMGLRTKLWDMIYTDTVKSPGSSANIYVPVPIYTYPYYTPQPPPPPHHHDHHYDPYGPHHHGGHR